MAADLKTRIWVAALIRRAEVAGAFAVVVRKGNPDAGTVLVTVRVPNGQTTLYRPVRNMAGKRVWWPKGPAQETDIMEYIVKRLEGDPDLWVVEIEDREGRHFLTDPIEDNA